MKEEINEIQKLAEPLMKYLYKHYCPYDEIVITSKDVKIKNTILFAHKAESPL